MDIKGNTILITGGATGIGFSLAEAFVNAGNEVIICGRRENKLEEAKRKLPQLHIKKCDLSKENERKMLFEWTSSNFPNLNILVNNAGIQRRIDFKKGTEELFTGEDEIEINLKAYVQLSAYFTPFLLKKKEAAIINVSSGLGFIPLAIFPIYCATKAAVHSFSISLRHQLKNTPIKVFEIIPPTVNTELSGGKTNGIPPAEVAETAIKAIEKDEYEIPVGMAQNLRMGARNNPDEAFQNLNKW
jgi:uncharacterized oxidoreductase